MTREAFETQALDMGLDPTSVWVGGYVEYEWSHLRPILDAYGLDVGDRRVLEFGCNFGASATVLSLLDASVDAVDVDEKFVQLARRNAAQYGVDHINFKHVEDTRELPFETSRFDLILCNSVLEYVRHDYLPIVLKELDRLLQPGGHVLITGTSSRLWPKECHSGRWLTNYVPRFLDPLLPGGSPTRGVFPWQLRNGFGSGYQNVDVENRNTAFVGARANMQPARDSAAVRLVARFANTLGIGAGTVLQNISMLLRKPAD